MSDLNNPLGGLSFWYQINNTGSSVVEGLSLNGFLGVGADVGYITTAVAAATGSLAGTVIPTDATRPAGTPLHWDYSIPVLGGPATGDILVVNTALTTWGGASGSVQDGNAQDIRILAPVPEPTTILAGALLLLPFGASTLRILRKRQMA
jgi:hypothetical protein